MWTLSGWLHRIQVVFLETVMCAVVAFFVADLGLDVFRVQYRDGSSEVAYNNVLFYVAVIVPLFLSLCARAGPCLVYCLPEWARSQSHQVRISKSSKKMDPAPRPLRSSRGADRTTTTPPPPTTTTTTTAATATATAPPQRVRPQPVLILALNAPHAMRSPSPFPLPSLTPANAPTRPLTILVIVSEIIATP